jgi:hypothetical protein
MTTTGMTKIFQRKPRGTDRSTKTGSLKKYWRRTYEG